MCQKAAFGGQALAGGAVVDRLQHGRGAAVIGAPFDPDGPLGDGWQHVFGGDGRARHIGHVQPVQARHSQKCRLGHTIAQLHQAGLHIAAKFHDVQVGPTHQQLRPPPQGRCADRGAVFQIIQTLGRQRHKRIAHILARQIGIQQQTTGLFDRHVLHRMDRDVDRAIQ